MSTHTRSEPVELRTADGFALEAELGIPSENPRALMVLCHPHPLHGGNMHAGVIDGLFRSLPDHGVACLRFNFRGVGASEGEHGEGVAEQHDVVAAIEDLGSRWPETDLTLAGWSFGADVALSVGHDRHRGWFGIAPPLRIVSPADMAAPSDERPTVLAIPEHDQFNPPSDASETTAGWQHTSQWVVPSADHFLAGGLERVVELALLSLE